MTGIVPIASVAQTSTAPVSIASGVRAGQDGGGFGAMLGRAFAGVETRVGHADDMVRRFALGEAIPVHQVTYALEEARLSIELAMQVRSRLVETYRELMNMQL